MKSPPAVLGQNSEKTLSKIGQRKRKKKPEAGMDQGKGPFGKLFRRKGIGLNTREREVLKLSHRVLAIKIEFQRALHHQILKMHTVLRTILPMKLNLT